jgi:hypothetical protein
MTRFFEERESERKITQEISHRRKVTKWRKREQLLFMIVSERNPIRTEENEKNFIFLPLFR